VINFLVVFRHTALTGYIYIYQLIAQYKVTNKKLGKTQFFDVCRGVSYRNKGFVTIQKNNVFFIGHSQQGR